MEKEVYLKIKGRVQGIGFRWWAVKTAEEIGGISGWVHNAADGSVEILMSGEEDNIDRMILACHAGPPLARVDSVNFIVGRRSGFCRRLWQVYSKEFEIQSFLCGLKVSLPTSVYAAVLLTTVIRHILQTFSVVDMAD